jgi:hypothetical protein
MKRVLLGTKRKKAVPARKPVAKKAKLTKVTARSETKKRGPAKKTKPVAKLNATKAKVIRRVKPAIAKRSSVGKLERAVGAPVSRPDPKRLSATQLAAPKVEASERATPANETRRKSARKFAPGPKLNVPAFLLEGDEPSHPEVSGPGEKFSLGPTPPLDHFDEAKAPLPESYGTGKLFLTARDPHWLYAHWDFTREEQFRHNARSEDRHLVLRVHPAAPAVPPVAEYHVHPESKHWFIHVESAGETYFTELGYYQPGHKWHSLAFSAPQRTPPDNISADSTVKFATIPTELSFNTMLALLKETAGEAAAKEPLAHGVDKIRPRAGEHFPKTAPGDWSPEQEQALAEIIATAQAGIALPGSEEFVARETAQVWPEFTFDFESGATAPLPSSYVSSFLGGAEQKDFWLNVNAELIIYGATEPNATVTFAGKQIQLQPDGSFRFRFALPDGQYELPITAVSADGTDGRAVELKFTRATEARGHVVAAPNDPALKPPPSESA